MFSKLILKDFQSHQSLQIDLDPEVTSIVGPSDAGKSAVLRALQWVATNRPSGHAFIRDGSKEAAVTLEVDKCEITRRRTKTVNIYELDGQEFKAFGNSVPEPIAALLKLSDINFQGQHDSPFWFTASAGEVSRQLNQIVDLEIIDRTLANINRMCRDSAGKVRVLEEQLKEAKLTRRDLKWVLKAKQEMDDVEEQCQSSAEAWKICARLEDLVESCTKYTENQKRLRTAAKKGQRLVKKGEELAELQAKIERLNDIVNDIRSYEVIAQRPIPKMEPLTELAQQDSSIQKLEAQGKHLRGIVTTIREAMAVVENINQKLDETKRQYEDEKGETCPLCGQTW